MVEKPWLKLRAFLMRETSFAGIGLPVSWCTANFSSTSGTISQCS